LGIGKTQIGAEVLACGSENVISNDIMIDQNIFVMRIISMNVTFYKTVIPIAYFEELGKGLPRKQSVMIERWSGTNGKTTGLDLIGPEGRKAVLNALIKIRQYLLE